MWRWLLLGGPHIFWAAAFLYLFNTKGRYHFNYDTISVALTSLEIIIVVFGLMGFGYLTILAERTAKEKAIEVAGKEAKEEIEKIVPSMVRRAVRDEMDALTAAGQDGTDEQIKALMKELDGEGDKNAK